MISKNQTALRLAFVTLVLGVVDSTRDRAAAQYGPVFGYGGWGQSAAWSNQTGGAGMTPFGPVNPGGTPAQLAARYQIQNAQAARAYQESMIMQQQAAAAALGKQREEQQMQVRFDARSGVPLAGQNDPRQSAPPIKQLLNADGKPRWPVGIAADKELDSKRDEADAAIAHAFRENQADGQATVASVVKAKEKLVDYGQLALKRTSPKNRARSNSLRSYLQSLDMALDNLAGPAQ